MQPPDSTLRPLALPADDEILASVPPDASDLRVEGDHLVWSEYGTSRYPAARRRRRTPTWGECAYARLNSSNSTLSWSGPTRSDACFPGQRRHSWPASVTCSRSMKLALAAARPTCAVRSAGSGLIHPRPIELALADEVAVADICNLAAAFMQTQTGLLGGSHCLNPTFSGSRDVGGADADLVANGCLIEIKTTIERRLDRRWAYQLLGYALLDYGDDHHITEVGFYLSRVPALVKWDLEALLTEAAGRRVDVAELRAELQQLLAAIREARVAAGRATVTARRR